MKKFNNFKEFASKNAASAMAIAAMIGVPITCFFVAKETPGFNEKIKENPDASFGDKMITGIMSYKKSLLAALLTEGAIFGSNHINHRNISALSALCASQVVNLKQVEEKATELFGKDKVIEAKKAVVEEKLHQPEYLDGAIHTNHGNVLCYEPYIDKFFYASQAWIEQQAARADRDMHKFKHDYFMFYEWMDYLNVRDESRFGKEFGFRYYEHDEILALCLIPGKTGDGLPYIMLEYDNDPVYLG